MAHYAIGDVQGCNEELGELLRAIDHRPDRDRLWFVGDLVNRGPDSLGVLRRVRALGDAAVVTLGNHDLHLLAVSMGRARQRQGDTLAEVLAAPDRDINLDWLRHRALLHDDPELGMCLLHAGLAPQWDLSLARSCARECEHALRRDPEPLFARMYGDEPDRWSPDLDHEQRLRFTINCLTRLRYVDLEGHLALRAKGSPQKMQTKPHDKPLLPWFEAPDARWRRSGARLVFGHWSTLGFLSNDRVIALDTGCVWGGALTALRLDVPDAKPVQVGCRQHSPIE